MSDSIEEIVAENQRIEHILASGERDRLLAVPGVFHVTTGLKEVAGRATDELCVKTYVREKRAVADLAHDPVPPAVSGVRTDVSEVPEIVFTADDSSHRPLVGGIQITNGIKELKDDLSGIEMHRGTLGCFATLKADGKPVLLTNWHVVTANGGRIGDSIFQPVPETVVDKLEDDFPKRPKSSKNAVAKIVDAKVGAKFDCAIARVNTCYSCCCNCGIGFKNVIRALALGGGDAVAGTAPAPVVAKQPVFKVGRATDRTAGKVVTANFPSFPIVRDGTTYTFTGQIQIEGDSGPFATRGDSGAVVVDGNRKVVGLQFASPVGDAFALANHIADVTEQMGITITGGEHALVEAGGQVEILDLLSTRLAGSAEGTRLSERVAAHEAEIVRLVNHDRRVLVVWHRIQGPSWLAALVRSAREPAYRIPEEIAGVTRVDALTRLRDVLVQYGSDELRPDLERYFEPLLAAFTRSHTTEELLEYAGKVAPARIGGVDAKNT